MWFKNKQTKQETIFLIIDDNKAALISWGNDVQTTYPFRVNSYTALPEEWFLHGAPWHMKPFTNYLRSYVTSYNLKNPFLVCACSSETTYEKTVSLSHPPTQSSIPPDEQFTHYAWHATKLQKEPSSYLISGLPQSTLLRLRLCIDKSQCVLNRITTLRASMQPLYDYYQQNILSSITLQNETAMLETLMSALCTPQPKSYNQRLILASLGLHLFKGNSL